MSDSIIKIAKRDRNFTAFDKEIMMNPNISFRAKGLFAYLMGLPDDWTVRVGDISNRATEGRDALRTAFKELYDAGYAKREAVRAEDGKMEGTRIVIYETVGTKEIPVIQKKPVEKEVSHKVYPSIPKELQCDKFSEAWKDWIKYRAERKSKLTPSTMNMQLKKLAKLGPDEAVRLIERSIENGWMGLIFDKSGTTAKVQKRRLVC